jgi:hypothetical protein
MVGPVTMKNAQGLQALEMLSECAVDNLRNGQAVEVSLTPDRLDPAALDMEGDALGLLGGIADLRGEVYPTPDLARLANEQALRKNSRVDSKCT